MSFSGQPRWWHTPRKTGFAELTAAVRLAGFAGLAALTATAFLLAGEVQAKGSNEPVIGAVDLTSLPVEAAATYRLIFAGGPFPNQQDGRVFGNRERLLPVEARGAYHEYTVRTPNAHDRGARRIVCAGNPPTRPRACFYTGDHYASFQLIAR